jgi:hypothetical protein
MFLKDITGEIMNLSLYKRIHVLGSDVMADYDLVIRCDTKEDAEGVVDLIFEKLYGVLKIRMVNKEDGIHII